MFQFPSTRRLSKDASASGVETPGSPTHQAVEQGRETPGVETPGSRPVFTLPDGWSARRLRSIAQMRVSNVDKNTLNDEVPIRLCNYVDVYKRDVITAGLPFMRATATPEEVRLFGLERGDVIITKDSETYQDIGVPAYVASTADDLVCGYHLAILRPYPFVMSGEYLYWALRTTAVAHQLRVAARGVTRFGLTQGDIKSAWVPVPPPDEQAAIVKYLAHATTRIDKTIAAKRRLIALLEEQRDAIADEYVTGRIEPSLRDTGLTWLPTVPEGWDVCPLKRHWRIVDCKHLTVPFIEDGIPLASIRQAQRFFLDLSEAKRTDRANYENLIEGGRRPSRGDLIYCRNVSVGAAAVVSTDEVFALGQDVCLLHSRDQSAVFLNHFLRSSAMRAQLEMLLVGSTFRRINVEDVRGLLTVVPPTHRQEELSAQIAERTAPMLRAVERAAREIVLLQEFRTRLIADVVTGQVDVRGIASTLPDIDPTTAWAVPDPDDPDPGASDPDNDDVPDA